MGKTSRGLKGFKCVRCGAEEEALPTGMTDVMGGSHFVYTTPKGWWNITTEVGMLMFCSSEDAVIVTAEIIDAMHTIEVQPSDIDGDKTGGDRCSGLC